MSQPTEPDGARPSPLPVEGIAAKRPPRHLSPNLLAIKAHQVASSLEPVEIKEGTLIGDYSVQKRLDEGGMGTVYSAVHPVIGKKVAIKVLHPHVARQEEAVARFIQEARAVNALGHPGIVDIFGFGRFVDGRHYITMEYLEGQQLLAYINEHGPIPALAVLPLSRQLAESLAAAHDKGVVHRDMKPENVFLGVTPGKREHHPWPPRTKILDFGLAKLIEAEFSNRKPRTRAGVTVGTPYYMSPEQCRGKAIDRRADVYALGVMMYEMVTGRVPFYAAESVDVLYMHLTQEPEAPSSHRPVPPEIEALILRCMAKTPADRPQNMHELIAELDAVMEELMPSEGIADRPEHELLQEAEAFFGGSVAFPQADLAESATTTERMDQITIPMSAEELILPMEALPSGSAGLEVQPAPAPEVRDEDAASTGADMPAPSETPVKIYSKPAGHGVPSLPTPDAPADVVPVDVVHEEPEKLAEETLPRPSSRPPALGGFKTAITAVPSKPRQRALWAAVISLGVAVVVLAALLIVGSSRKAPTAPRAAPLDVGSVELRCAEPVDIYLDGRPVARMVRRMLVTRLPAGSTQVFEIKRADGSVHRTTVRVAAARTISVTIPLR
jgi:serine/threonine-protein kinase